MAALPNLDLTARTGAPAACPLARMSRQCDTEPQSERTTMSEIQYTTGNSSLGSVLIAGTESGVCAILLGNHPQELIDELGSWYPDSTLSRSDLVFEQLVSRVIDSIEKP